MKLNLDTIYGTDKKKEVEGVWYDLGEDQPKFLLKRYHELNPQMQASQARHFKPYARQISMGTLPIEKQYEILINIFLDTTLIGWKDIKDESGSDVPFSKEMAKKVLIQYPDLFEELKAFASKADNYKEVVGNS
jgi:hypothetical protein